MKLSVPLAVFLGFLAMLDGVSTASWSKYKRSFSVTCPNGKGLSNFYSYYSRSYKDRKYLFYCQRSVGSYSSSKDCYWTRYANWYRESYVYANCPLNFIPAGVSSVFHSSYGDRRWRFRCCRVKGQHKKSSHCYWKHYSNDYRGYLSFRLPHDRIIANFRMGPYSSSYRDRRWKVYVCPKYAR